MHEVEIGEVAVLCGIHAHGGHPDAVLEGQISDGDGGEKSGWIGLECCADWGGSVECEF